MHEFGSVKECPKCGSSDGPARTTLEDASVGNLAECPHGRTIRGKRYCHPDCVKCGGKGVFGSPPHPERLKRICPCGYTWYEKPKDAKGENDG